MHGRHTSSARHTASPRSTPAVGTPPWNSAVPSGPFSCRSCPVGASLPGWGQGQPASRREQLSHTRCVPEGCFAATSRDCFRKLAVVCILQRGKLRLLVSPSRGHGGGANPVGLGAIPKPVCGTHLPCHRSEGRTLRTCPLPGACSVRPPLWSRCIVPRSWGVSVVVPWSSLTLSSPLLQGSPKRLIQGRFTLPGR